MGGVLSGLQRRVWPCWSRAGSAAETQRTQREFKDRRYDACVRAGRASRRYNLSILAARMKSLSVRPLILCVQVVTSALPQVNWMSG
jgi:hypothetical protein